MTTIKVRSYDRTKPEKPRQYIDTHMAMFSRRSDAIMFAQRHGVLLVSEDDPRLQAPIPEPVYGGRFSLSRVASELKQLARMGRK